MVERTISEISRFAMVFELVVVLSGLGDPSLGVSTFGGAAVGIDANTALVTIEAETSELEFTFANSWAGGYTLTSKLSQIISS